jgi:hypothetical protein
MLAVQVKVVLSCAPLLKEGQLSLQLNERATCEVRVGIACSEPWISFPRIILLQYVLSVGSLAFCELKDMVDERGLLLP